MNPTEAITDMFIKQFIQLRKFKIHFIYNFKLQWSVKCIQLKKNKFTILRQQIARQP